MKPFLFLMGAVLVAALVGPFFLKGPGGKPLMSIDGVVEDSTPEFMKKHTPIYRWKDKFGVWQFGESPPEGVNAEPMTVDDKITRMDDGWHVKPLDEEDPAGGSQEFEVPGVAGALLNSKKLMHQAETEVGKMNAKTQAMDDLMNNIQKRQ